MFSSMSKELVEGRAEKWLPVVGWVGLYEVSSYGRVRSAPGRFASYQRLGQAFIRPVPSKVLTPYQDADGYLRVKFSRVADEGVGNIVKRPKVHTLVCEAFNGTRPPNMQAAHGDGDLLNCRSGNLRWATPAENTGDKVRHGTLLLGEDVATAKLSTEQVLAIREAAGSLKHIAARFEISRSQVSRIKLRQRWAHVT